MPRVLADLSSGCTITTFRQDLHKIVCCDDHQTENILSSCNFLSQNELAKTKSNLYTCSN